MAATVVVKVQKPTITKSSLYSLGRVNMSDRNKTAKGLEKPGPRLAGHLPTSIKFLLSRPRPEKIKTQVPLAVGDALGKTQPLHP